MSTTVLPNGSTNAVIQSEWASEDWDLQEKTPVLIIQTRKQNFIFPWMRFLFAEGDNGKVMLTFGTHLITINGHGLDAMLAAIGSQQLRRIKQPTTNEAQFGVRGADVHRYAGAGISTISVEHF